MPTRLWGASCTSPFDCQNSKQKSCAPSHVRAREVEGEEEEEEDDDDECDDDDDEEEDCSPVMSCSLAKHSRAVRATA